MYDIGISELFLHCLVTRLFALRQEMRVITEEYSVTEETKGLLSPEHTHTHTSASTSSSQSSSSSSVVWQRQALLEDFIKTHESLLLKMHPSHIQILTLLITSIDLPPIDTPGSGSISASGSVPVPLSALESSLQTLRSKVPPSVLAYAAAQQAAYQQDDRDLAADSSRPHPHSFHLGLSPPTVIHLLTAMQRMKFKDVSSTALGAKGKADNGTDTEAAGSESGSGLLLPMPTWMDVLQRYYSVWETLSQPSPASSPASFSAPFAWATEYSRGLYSREAREQLVVQCCLPHQLQLLTPAPRTPAPAGRGRNADKDSYTETGAFRTLLTTLQGLQEPLKTGAVGTDTDTLSLAPPPHALDWARMGTDVAAAAIPSLLQHVCTTSRGSDLRDSVRVREGSSEAEMLTGAGSLSSLFLNNCHDALFVNAWHLFEKLSLLCSVIGGGARGDASGGAGADAGGSHRLLPEHISDKILASINTFSHSEDTTSLPSCEVFASLATVTKALSAFTTGTATYSCSASRVTLVYCLTNAYLSAPCNGTELVSMPCSVSELSEAGQDTADTSVASISLSPVPWTMFQDFQAGNSAPLQAWLQRLIAQALSPALSPGGGSPTGLLSTTVHGVLRFLRALGLSASAGQARCLTHSWRAVSFRTLRHAIHLSSAGHDPAQMKAKEQQEEEEEGGQRLVQLANTCWRQVLQALAAASAHARAGTSCCPFPLLFLEVVLLDFHHSPSPAPSLPASSQRVPGDMSLQHLLPPLPPLPVPLTESESMASSESSGHTGCGGAGGGGDDARVQTQDGPALSLPLSLPADILQMAEDNLPDFFASAVSALLLSPFLSVCILACFLRAVALKC